MPNANYERGVRFERELKAKLEAKGCQVFRTAGSHGAFDLIAVAPYDEPQFIQCKVLKDGDEKAAYMLIRKFVHSPPLPPCERYVQIIAVKIKGGKVIEEAV